MDDGEGSNSIFAEQTQERYEKILEDVWVVVLQGPEKRVDGHYAQVVDASFIE